MAQSQPGANDANHTAQGVAVADEGSDVLDIIGAAGDQYVSSFALSASANDWYCRHCWVTG